MKLVPNWKQVLFKSHSIKLIILSILFMVADPIYNWWVGHLDGVDENVQLILIIIGALISVAAIGARIIFQKEISDADKDE